MVCDHFYIVVGSPAFAVVGPYLTEEAAEDGARFARLVNYRIELDPSPYGARVG
jgi:hypothetical protein